MEFGQRESDPNMRSTLNSIYRSIRQMRLLISYNDMRMKLFIALHASWATFLFSLLVPFEYHVKKETLILEYDNLSPWKQYLSNSPSLACLNLCFVITANVFFLIPMMCSKCFTCINPLNPHNIHMRQVLLCSNITDE